MSSSGVLQFETANYELIPNNTNANRIVNTNLDASYYTQNVSTLANITEPVRTSDGEFLKTPHYVIFDADSADQLKLIKYNDTDLSIPFWFNAGTGNTLSTAVTSNSLTVWTNHTGNAGEATRGYISFTKGTKKVIGFQTYFTEDLKVGDVLRLYSTSYPNPFGIVSVIESDTVLFVETSITANTPVSNRSQYQRLLFRPDYINDVVLAYVYKTAAEGFKFKSFLTLESNLTAAPPSTTGLVHYIACNSLSGGNKLRDSVGAAIPTIVGSGFSINEDSPVGKSYVNTENDGVLLLTDAQADTWESNNWSVFLYINSSSTTGAATARVIERDSTKQWGIRLNQSTNTNFQPLSFYFGGNTSDTPTQGIISPNRWYHVGIVYNGTSLTYFLDGFPVSTAAYNPTAADRVIALGCATTSGTGISSTLDNFLGKFSEIRFYNKNLTNEEVMGLAQLPGGGGIGSSVDPELLDSSGAQTVGSGNSVVTIDGGTDSNSSDNSTVYRLWAGHTDPDSAPFKVTDGGKVSLTSGAAHSLNLTATGGSLVLGTNSILTLPDDFISGNVIHGGTISGLTGLDISGNASTFPISNKPIFTITNTNTSPSTGSLGGAIGFRHSAGTNTAGDTIPLRAGRISSKYYAGSGNAAEHALHFSTGTDADIGIVAGQRTIAMKQIFASAVTQAALGIGTLSPTKNLHIFGVHPTIRVESSSAGTSSIDFLGSADNGTAKGRIDYSNSLHRLTIYTDAGLGLLIDANQNITAYGNLTGVVNFAYSGTFTGVNNTINASYLTHGSTGDINILRNAATATILETARNIGGVSFDGSANINLPGVNIAGNQDTSGNAATATALAASKDFTIGTTDHAFDGSANVDLSEAVRALVAGFIVGGTNVTATHNDAANTLTLAASGSGGSGGSGGIALTDLSVTAEATAAGDGALSYNSGNGQFTYTPPVDITGNAATATALAASKDFTIGTTDHAFDGSANVDLSEAVRALVAGFIVGGTNVTATHNDTANTLTLAASSVQGGDISSATTAAIPTGTDAGYGLYTDGSLIAGDANRHILVNTSGELNVVGLTSDEVIGASTGIVEIIEFDAYKDDRFYPYWVATSSNSNVKLPMASYTYASQSNLGRTAYSSIFGSTSPSSTLRSAWDAKHLGSQNNSSGTANNYLTMGTIPAKSFTYRPYLQFHGNIQVYDHAEIRFQVQHNIDTGASVVNSFNIVGSQFSAFYYPYIMTIPNTATNYSTFNTNKNSYVGQDVTVVSNNQTLTLQISSISIVGSNAYVYFSTPVTWFSSNAAAAMTLPSITATTTAFTNVGKEFRVTSNHGDRSTDLATFSAFFEDYVPSGADVNIRVLVRKYNTDSSNDHSRRADEITSGTNWDWNGNIEGTLTGDDTDVISEFTMTALIGRGV